MSDPSQLTFEEAAMVLGLVGLIVYEAFQAYRSRRWVSVYRPTLVVAVIIGWYALLSPLQQLFSTGAAISRGLNHRDFLLSGWTGALVFYGALLVGFHMAPRLKPPRCMILQCRTESIHALGLRLCLVGVGMFSLVAGAGFLALLNPFRAASAIDEAAAVGLDLGFFSNYFNLSVNLFIPGICLMTAAWLRQRLHTTTLLCWFLVSAGIYTSLGFRYRLVLLVIPMLLLWFMARSKRPPMALLALFLTGFMVINSIIGSTRTYGRGLDLSLLEGRSVQDLTGDSGLGEQGVFFATAGVIHQAPELAPFVGATPLVSTLLFPIPRGLFPAKPEAEYVRDALDTLYGRIYSPGGAFLNYAEYYLIAGWPSLIAMSMALGWLLRRLWNWFLWRQDEPFAQVIYLLSASYLYMVISRGYMPQVVMLFMFTVAPLYWLYGRWAQPVASQDAPPSLPRS